MHIFRSKILLKIINSSFYQKKYLRFFRSPRRGRIYLLEIFSRSDEEEFDYNDSNDHQDHSIDHHDYDYKEHSKTLDYDNKDHRKTQDYDYKDHSKTLDYNYKEHSKTQDYDEKDHSKTQDYDYKGLSKTLNYDNKDHSKTHDNVIKDLNDIPTNMKILNQIKSSRIKKLENPFGRNDIIKDDSLEMNRRDVNEEQLGVDALEKHDPLDLVQIMALKRHIAVAKSHSTSNLDFRHNSQIFMIFIFILYT